VERQSCDGAIPERIETSWGRGWVSRDPGTWSTCLMGLVSLHYLHLTIHRFDYSIAMFVCVGLGVVINFKYTIFVHVCGGPLNVTVPLNVTGYIYGWGW
jgi:hypothetical protein